MADNFLKQIYTSHLKVLMCGIDASSSQWCDCIFIPEVGTFAH